MRLLRFARNDENSRISKPCVIPQLDWGISFKIPFKIPLLRERILNFSEVLGHPSV